MGPVGTKPGDKKFSTCASDSSDIPSGYVKIAIENGQL